MTWPRLRRQLLTRRVVVIFVAALAVRLVYWALYLRHYVPASDAKHYEGIARSLAAGQGFSHLYPSATLHPTAFRPPLYPLLLGAVYAVFGARLALAQLLNALVGSANVVIGSTMGSRIGAGGRASLLPSA